MVAAAPHAVLRVHRTLLALVLLIAAGTLESALVDDACVESRASRSTAGSTCPQVILQEARYSSSSPVLLQRHSVTESRAVPPESNLESAQQELAEADVKFLAGVPVYNYGYVTRLAFCEEAGHVNCELDLLQFNGSQAFHRPVRGLKKDWESDLLHDGKRHHASSPRSSERDASFGYRRHRHPGRVREWLVKMRDGISDQIIRNFCVVLPGNAKCMAQGHPSKGGIPLVVIKGTEDELEEQLRRHTGKCDYVEPDIPMDAIPEVRSKEAEEDKAYYDSKKAGTKKNKGRGNNSEPSSWGLDRIDDRYGLDDSYTIGLDGGRGAHVYIADTGIRTTHHDFHGRARPTLEIRKGIIHECDPSNDKCAQDDNGHGTHAAATVGGKMYGVAKACTIHSVKILSDTGRGKMSYLIQALDWVATYGLRPAIFTASIGATGNPPSVVKAIEAASAAGVTVIVGAGNFGRDACGFTPAHVKSAITVGATEDAEDTVAPYSNFGKCVDLFAPGSNIHSAGRMSDTARATMTGTSMATPHVAGAAALLLSEDITRTPEEVSLLLRARATQGTVQGGTSGLMLYVAAPGETDEIWWQSAFIPSWWKLFKWTRWTDLVRPGPIKELVAEAGVCCLFLLSLAFMLTKCLQSDFKVR